MRDVPSGQNAERELFAIDLNGALPDRRFERHLLWSAPGSCAEAVAFLGAGVAGLKDLANVSGPWGVAYWEPEDSSYVLAVDALGVQPLFWTAVAGDRILVGSWLAKLVDHPHVDASIDIAGAIIVAGRCFTPAVLDRTSFASIRKIPAGHTVRLREGQAPQLRSYWDPRSVSDPDPSLSLAECAMKVRQRVEIAVRRSMPPGAIVGAHVSGGLDSSAVACRANQILVSEGSKLTAGYTWSPDEQVLPRMVGDERAFVETIALSESITIRGLPKDPIRDWFADLDPLQYPEGTHRLERWILPQAQEDRLDLLLSGWGGDECVSFNGRGIASQLVRGGRFFTLWREVTARSGVEASESFSQRSAIRTFSASVVGASPPWVRGMRHPISHLRQRLADRDIYRALSEVSELVADTNVDSDKAFRQMRSPRQYQEALLSYGHLQARCSDWYQTGRLFGLDYRFPLLDLQVVETALQLPWRAWRHEGWDRAAFRSAVAPWVPDSIAWRVDKTDPAIDALDLGVGSPYRALPDRFERFGLNDGGISEAIRLIQTPR